MTLRDAITALNDASAQQITLGPTRDGRVTAHLPRLGSEILVESSAFNPEAKVGAHDLALLYEEARLAMAPALAVMQATGSLLRQIEKKHG